MSDRSPIEWTDATWNPVTGCTKVSAGCDRCYAETFAERWRGVPGHHFKAGFDLTLRPARLELPLRWRRPRRVFVNSMSDLFHDQVPEQYIARVFAVMAATPHHTYQLLTKRHGRMRSLLSRGGLSTDGFADTVEEAMAGFTHAGLEEWPLPNVWLGVSVEDQPWAELRVPALLDTPAAVRWVSAEPLLGPVELDRLTLVRPRPPHGPGVWLNALTGYVLGTDDVLPRLDWVVTGGESGPGARPMHPDWAGALRDQCADAGVPFLFKQWGGRTPKSGGRLLDGRTHDQYPQPRTNTEARPAAGREVPADA